MALPAPAHLPSLRHEHALLVQGFTRIAGVDEVGRGAWAGPVVAAAVILPLADPLLTEALHGVRDSKQTTADERAELFQSIKQVAISIGLGWASHHAIDRIGIAPANRQALLRATRGLRPAAECLLLDYFRLPECTLPQIAMPRGDAESLSIAAASIVAKVVRDHWMERVDPRYPHYGFGRHKGYGTREHRESLDRHGPCLIHRQSYAPIQRFLL